MAGWKCAASVLFLFTIFVLDSRVHALSIVDLSNNYTLNCSELTKKIETSNATIEYTIEYVYMNNDSLYFSYNGSLSGNMHCGWPIWKSFYDPYCYCFKNESEGNATQGNTTTSMNSTTEMPTNTTTISMNTTTIPMNTTMMDTNTTAVPMNTTILDTNTTIIPMNTTTIPINTTIMDTNATTMFTNTTTMAIETTTTPPTTTTMPILTTTATTTLVTNATPPPVAMSDAISAFVESPVSAVATNATMIVKSNFTSGQVFNCTVINDSPTFQCQQVSRIQTNETSSNETSFYEEVPETILSDDPTSLTATVSECPLGNNRVVFDPALSCVRFFNSPASFYESIDVALHEAKFYFNNLTLKYGGAEHYKNMSEICSKCRGSSHECCNVTRFLPYSDKHTCCSGLYASCSSDFNPEAAVIFRSCQPNRMNKYVSYDVYGNFRFEDKPSNMQEIYCAADWRKMIAYS